MQKDRGAAQVQKRVDAQDRKGSGATEVSKLQQLASQLFRCRRSSKMALGLSFPLSGK